MNTVLIKNRKYLYESFWRDYKRVPIYDNNNVIFPWPKPYNLTRDWQNKDIFITKLLAIEKHLINKTKFLKYNKNDYKDCHICEHKRITDKLLEINGIRWENGLMHYIKIHNIKPTNQFIDFIFKYNIKETQKRIKIDGKTVIKKNRTYLKLDRNQIHVMDALMKHGSKKRYISSDKLDSIKRPMSQFKYSEHSGLLDFNNNVLEKIIISAGTNRIEETDTDIFLPRNMSDAFDYEYMFHTHPATPSPGGRAKVGVLYEVPSPSDMLHFIQHHNNGMTQGSIIIAAEGLYIIRKYKQDKKKININFNNFFKTYMKIIRNVQNKFIDKYGTDFTGYIFYSVIAQNISFIKQINKIINKFDLHIDYYPRIKNDRSQWIIDTVYLPVQTIEYIN